MPRHLPKACPMFIYLYRGLGSLDTTGAKLLRRALGNQLVVLIPQLHIGVRLCSIQKGADKLAFVISSTQQHCLHTSVHSRICSKELQIKSINRLLPGRRYDKVPVLAHVGID